MAKSLVTGLSAIILLLAICFSGGAVADDLRALPVPLHPTDEAIDRVGSLTYRGGLVLKSRDGRFGGVSGMTVDRDGRTAHVITDKGNWTVLRFDLSHRLRLRDAKQIQPILPLRDPRGRPLSRPNYDAEGLTRLPGGDFLVSFEHGHRLWRYPGLLSARAEPEPAPPDLAELGDNLGIEAVTALAGGGLLMIAEGGQFADRVPAWIRDAGGVWHRISYQLRPPYRPTDAGLLPNGDVIVLERRFSFLGGFGSRIVRLPAPSMQSGQVLRGEELATLEPPLITENFEGLAAHRFASGRALLFLVSDDNFSPLQRTVLLAFELPQPM